MTKNGRIVVTGSPDVLTDVLLSDLTDAGFEIDRLPEREPSIEQVRQKLPGAVGYLFGGFEFLDSETLSAGNALQAVSLLGEDTPGFLDLTKAKEIGIQVSNTPGATTKAVAEFVVAEVLATSRALVDIVCPDQSNANGYAKNKARELSSQTVGVIGLGRIGTAIADTMSKAFGAKILYWNRTPKPDLESSLGIEYRELGKLLRDSDILIVSIASHVDTELLLDRALLEQARHGSSLFCISKSRVMDFAAMVDQLEAGRLKCAWLDWVDKDFHFEQSTKSEFEKRLADCSRRLRISGHVANDTVEAWNRMAAMASSSLRNLLLDGSDQFEVMF